MAGAVKQDAAGGGVEETALIGVGVELEAVLDPASGVGRRRGGGRGGRVFG